MRSLITNLFACHYDVRGSMLRTCAWMCAHAFALLLSLHTGALARLGCGIWCACALWLWHVVHRCKISTVVAFCSPMPDHSLAHMNVNVCSKALGRYHLWPVPSFFSCTGRHGDEATCIRTCDEATGFSTC